MSKNCGHTIPCGCNDTPLTTGSPCGQGVDCTGNPCAENFDSKCIYYRGDIILCGEDEVVQTDVTLAEALNSLVTYFCNQGGGGSGVISESLICGDTTIAVAGTSVSEALTSVVGFFCSIVTELVNSYNYGLFAQIEDSSTIVNTTTPSTIVGVGDGTLSVPAGGFKVADSFEVKTFGHISSANNQVFYIRLKINGVVADEIALDGISHTRLPQITDLHWGMEMYFTIRSLNTAPNSGDATILSAIRFTHESDASDKFNGYATTMLVNFDSDIPQTLDLEVEWGAASTSNSIYSETFVLNKTY